MRRYDDPVEVRRGRVLGTEGPEQFLWRGRLWKVREVLAHWVETGPWWQYSAVQAVLGADEDGYDGAHQNPYDSGQPGSSDGQQALLTLRGHVDLAAEREVWRVEAARGRTAAQDDGGRGVFDLVFDWAQGSWRLARCAD
jgi:hypothetical protein